MCVYLQLPERRGLSREDARVLLSAHVSRLEVPTVEQAKAAPPPDNVRWLTDDKFYLDDHGKPASKKKQ